LEQQGEEGNKTYQAFITRKGKIPEDLAHEITDRNIDSLLEFRENVALGLDKPTFENKRRWLERLQTTVTVTEGRTVITCRLEAKPMSFSLFGQKTSAYDS